MVVSIIVMLFLDGSINLLFRCAWINIFNRLLPDWGSINLCTYSFHNDHTVGSCVLHSHSLYWKLNWLSFTSLRFFQPQKILRFNSSHVFPALGTLWSILYIFLNVSSLIFLIYTNITYLKYLCTFWFLFPYNENIEWLTQYYIDLFVILLIAKGPRLPNDLISPLSVNLSEFI